MNSIPVAITLLLLLILCSTTGLHYNIWGQSQTGYSLKTLAATIWDCPEILVHAQCAGHNLKSGTQSRIPTCTVLCFILHTNTFLYKFYSASSRFCTSADTRIRYFYENTQQARIESGGVFLT